MSKRKKVNDVPTERFLLGPSVVSEQVSDNKHVYLMGCYHGTVVAQSTPKRKGSSSKKKKKKTSADTLVIPVEKLFDTLRRSHVRRPLYIFLETPLFDPCLVAAAYKHDSVHDDVTWVQQQHELQNDTNDYIGTLETLLASEMRANPLNYHMPFNTQTRDNIQVFCTDLRQDEGSFFAAMSALVRLGDGWDNEEHDGRNEWELASELLEYPFPWSFDTLILTNPHIKALLLRTHPGAPSERQIDIVVAFFRKQGEAISTVTKREVASLIRKLKPHAGRERFELSEHHALHEEFNALEAKYEHFWVSVMDLYLVLRMLRSPTRDTLVFTGAFHTDVYIKLFPKLGFTCVNAAEDESSNHVKVDITSFDWPFFS